MQDEFIGRLTSDMRVRDVLGYKIGKIARVYRDESAVLQLAGPSLREFDRQPRWPSIMEIKTGPLGLGTHLYVPVTSIREVVDDSVFLDMDKDDVVREMRHKPDYLAELV